MTDKRKIIIAGGRDFGTSDKESPRYPKYAEDWSLLNTSMFPLVTDFTDEYWMPYGDIEIVSGTAKGADQLGEDWAIVSCRPIKEFPANWQKFGKSAGIIRNRQMAEYADELVAFWDGKSRGTKNMIDTMLSLKKTVHVLFYE